MTNPKRQQPKEFDLTVHTPDGQYTLPARLLGVKTDAMGQTVGLAQVWRDPWGWSTPFVCNAAPKETDT